MIFLKYKSLDALLSASESARIFYGSLPDYVRGAVVKNSERITDEKSLRDFAESIMHEFN